MSLSFLRIHPTLRINIVSYYLFLQTVKILIFTFCTFPRVLCHTFGIWQLIYEYYNNSCLFNLDLISLLPNYLCIISPFAVIV